jgi:hypothetical protein
VLSMLWDYPRFYVIIVVILPLVLCCQCCAITFSFVLSMFWHYPRFYAIIILPVLPVSEVWNMGYSAPWTLLNNLFSSPVSRYLVKILYPDFFNDCSIGSWKCWLSLSLLLSLVFYSTHPQLFARSYIS